MSLSLSIMNCPKTLKKSDFNDIDILQVVQNKTFKYPKFIHNDTYLRVRFFSVIINIFFNLFSGSYLLSDDLYATSLTTLSDVHLTKVCSVCIFNANIRKISY